GFQAFRRIGVAGFSSGAAYLVATIGGVYLVVVSGAATVPLGAAIAQSLVLSYMFRAARLAQRLRRVATRFADEVTILVDFTIPAAISGLTSVPVLWAIQALLARSQFGFEAVAGYAAGLNFLTVVLFAPTIVNSVAMPWINRRRTVAGNDGFRSAL